jgi:acyl carrier protein phosphodiesterase
MNFLAHLYLSGDNEKIMIGNFLGDFVRGRNLAEKFESEIVLGIELHRAIDAFTDTHDIVSQSKRRLRTKYRHYAPVIVDIFYDHFLARNWASLHDKPLVDFARRAYGTLKRFYDILPDEARHMLPYMINGDWLVSYAETQGIQRALTGMSKRTKFDSKMDESIEDLLAGYDDFEKEFQTFFPELKIFSTTFIHNNRTKYLS